MSSVVDGYCTVRAKWNSGDADVEETAHPATFEELVAFLTRYRDRRVDGLVDASDELPGGLVGPLGGFGVEVVTRWGSVVETAAGRDAWFLFRHEPPPARCHSDRPPIEGVQVFFLDGGHHTELAAEMLVSREECLRTLRDWLDSGAFPG